MGTHNASLVTIPAGTYRMGDESDWAYADDGEAPMHPVELASFLIDRHAVSNEQFATFVDATGWQTDAESFGWSFVFAGLLPDEFPPDRAASRGHRGGGRSWGRIGGIPRDHSPTGPGDPITPSSTSPGTMPTPTAAGPGRDYPPKPNGKWRPAVASTVTPSPGARSSNRAGVIA